jgi:hypothetical protein
MVWSRKNLRFRHGSPCAELLKKKTASARSLGETWILKDVVSHTFLPKPERCTPKNLRKEDEG